VIIVGGGGHGLATAYYLAKEHGITNVAVLEKGWIGSGNAGRNTTIIRSNYCSRQHRLLRMVDEAVGGLEQDLNYNAMCRQRGVLNLYHSDAQRDAYARRGNAMRLNGVDAELLDASRCARWLPFLDYRQCALPDHGRPPAAPRRHRPPRRRRLGLRPRRRSARRRHHPELRGHRHPRDPNGKVTGVETTRGFIGAEEGRRGGRRQHLARRGDGRAEAADRKPCAAGLRLRRRSSR
jgi:heterotetrameric sarcosine oxidase beta subunit